MRVRLYSTPFMPFVRSSIILVGVLLTFALAGAGCTTPGASESGSPGDTTTTAASQSAASVAPSSAQAEARQLSPTPDSSRTLEQRLADASVQARIKQALVRNRTLRAFDFTPEVVRGHVTLQGNVDTREQYRRAERIVTSLDGVRDLTNRLTVDGQPVTDGETGTSASSDTVYHTVNRGETLWEIARKYEVSVDQLQSLNARTSSLQPGERIRVQ